MASGDGSVEVKITGSVDPSVAASAQAAKASISDLGTATTVSAKSMSDALKAAGGDLRKVSADMLGLGASAQASAAQVAASEAVETGAVTANTAATEVNTTAHINSRVAYEALILVHEALSGRYSRMASSALILAQAQAGAEGTSTALGFATSALGIAVIGTAAALALVAVSTVMASDRNDELIASTVGLGAASGVSAERMRELAGSHNNAGISINRSQEALEAFTAVGIRSSNTLANLVAATGNYAKLSGQDAPAAAKALAAAIADPIKGAADLNKQFSFLDETQLQTIATLVASGQQMEAQNYLSQTFRQRMEEANTAAGGLTSALASLGNEISNQNRVGGESIIFLKNEALALLGVAAAVDKVRVAKDQARAVQNADSAAAKPFSDATEAGQSAASLRQLETARAAVAAGLKADIALTGTHSDAVKADTETLAEYDRAVTSYLSPADKEHQITVLQTQAISAKTAAEKAAIAAQIERLKLSGQVVSQGEVDQKAGDAGALAGAKQDAKKGPKGPSDVSVWEEELHAKEIASNEFFKDETADEQKFWQDKLALTTAGSKDWLAVQGKIYEASKSLAHQAYSDQIASLDDQIEASKNDWTKEQALWAQKLAFIKSTYGEQSREYLDAHKAEEAEERRHQQELLQIAAANEKAALEQLKASLAARAAVRKTEEKVAESGVQDSNQGRPDGAIRAAQQIAALHKQLAQQEIADDQAVYAAEAVLAQKQIDDAAKTDGTLSAKYAQAVNAKSKLDTDYLNAYKQKQAQMVLTTVQDQEKIKAAWHSTIDPLVQSWGAATEGLINGTESWGQALASIGTTIENTVITALEQMAEKWLVNQIIGTTASATTSKAEITASAAVAGAAAYASTAAIPIVGPELAPEAAAIAYDATLAFALGSFAVGTNFVPNDMIAQIHAGERIIPAADNARLMRTLDMVSGGASAASSAPASTYGGDGGRGGDFHYHDHSGRLSAADIRANKSAFADAMAEAVRQGWRPKK